MTGAALPKQFIELGGKPVIVHTIEAFYKANPEVKIIIPLPAQWQDHFSEIKTQYFPQKNIQIAEGGQTRFHSVKNSLAYTAPGSLVAVHDAVRPVVSASFIREAFVHAAQNYTAIPVIPVAESLRRIENEKSTMVDRSHYYIVQTPQCFSQEIIQKAYSQVYKGEFTDDASVVEAAGFSLSFFDGNKSNIKITTREDLDLAEFLIEKIV